MIHLVIMMWLVSFIFSTSCSAAHDQIDPEDFRCMSLNNCTSLPEMCTTYYVDGNGYFSGGTLNGLQRAFQRISDMFQNVSDINQCVELMTSYLCHYYFPSCDQMTGEIIPVCGNSCTLTLNIEDCSALREIVNYELEQDNITLIGDSCSKTHHSFVNPFSLSENCLSIEDSLNQTFSLTCIEIPIDDNCRPLIAYSFYAPAAFDVTATFSSEIETFVGQLDILDSCRAFVSTMNCAFRYPPCNPETGKISLICRNNCAIVDEVSVECFTGRFRNGLEFPALNELLNTFVCLEPETYYNIPLQYIETMDPDDCYSLVSNDSVIPEANNDDSNDNNVVIIITAICSCVIVVAVIILATAILCMKGKKRREYVAKDMSVRYHSRDHLGLSLSYASDASSPYVNTSRMNMNGDNTQKARKSLLLQEVNHFLDYVHDKFSEVLLPVDTITKQGLLGKGAFGVVHKGEMVSSDGSVKAVAIKTIKSGSLDAMKDLIAESTIMKTFHHPNVLPLLGVCIDYDDEDVLKIVIPFMTNGDLKTFLKNNRLSLNNTQEYSKDLSEEILIKMCFDIAKGMEYLATKRFIHRDLAARNCMVDNLLSIKIADFGLARDIYSTEYYRADKHTTLPVKWMAIESLLDGYFDEKTDVWSYGVTCWEIFSLGRTPYPGVDNSSIITLLKTGERLEVPKLCPSEIDELIKSTWLENPDQRPTFASVVQQLSRNFAITNELKETINDTEETTKSKGYISILPK